MKWSQAMWASGPKYTSFDLPQAILSDFDEHIWSALIQSTRAFVPYMPYLFYISSGKDSPLEIDYKSLIGESGEQEFREIDKKYTLSEQELRLIKQWVGDDDLHHLETNPAPLVNVHRTYDGKTVITYWVRSSTPEYPVNFRLQATQFRRDKLRLTLINYTDFSPIDYLKTWLRWGWGAEAAIPLQHDVETTSAANELSSERGANVGTLRRVAEAHRLMKELDMGKVDACERAHTDPRTYDRWCMEATGEDRIER